MPVPNLFNPAGRDVSGAISGGLQDKLKRESGQLGLQVRKDESQLDSIISGIKQTNLIPDAQGKLAFMEQRANQLDVEERDSTHTREGIELLSGELDSGGDGSQFNQTMNDLLAQTRIGQGGASARAFAPDTIRKETGKDAEGNPTFGLFSRQLVFDPATQKSRAIETPIEGELVSSTGETITKKRQEEVNAVRNKKEAEETGSALGAAKSAPLVANTRSLITKAVKLAEKEAIAKGETLTDLKRAEAGLPAVRQMVEKLRELAPLATNTFGAKAWDALVKETGFGSTEGANARSKFIAIAANQALPLLRQMLGPAFTAAEGEKVLALLGDPDATPVQKMDQLDAYIDGQIRSIQSKQREVGQEVTATEELTTGQEMFSQVLGRAITETDITETLQANPELTREQLLQQLGAQ